MTHSKDPLGQDALIAEASRWFAALDAGTVGADAFETWRTSNPAHAVAYARIVANWEGIAPALVAPVAEDLPLPEQVSRRHWLRAAAVALPVAVLGSGFLVQQAYAWDNATTRIGETKRVALPDGSTAYLNTDTSLSWRFGRNERSLRLDRGEVALDMKRGEMAVLRANDAALPLAPGLFDARMVAGSAELTLVDGAVMHVSDADRQLMLRPNDSVIMDGNPSPRIATRSSEQVASLMAWRSGEIVFLDQSVADAAAEFNRHLVRKITIGDADLAQEKIGGRFDLDRPDQFLKAISLSFDARVTDTVDGYRLTR